MLRLVPLGPHRFERVLGPDAEMAREWDNGDLMLLKRAQNDEAYIDHLDEEKRIYDPQSPFPEVMASNMELVA